MHTAAMGAETLQDGRLTMLFFYIVCWRWVATMGGIIWNPVGFSSQRHFTLVYSDWDALLCDNNDPDSSKGPISVHFPLFECVV